MGKTVRRAALPLLMLAVLLLRAEAARQAAQTAVRQSALVVFPALFPFIVVSRRLTQSGLLDLRRGDRLSFRLFGVPAAGMGAVLMGLCGGYPVGVTSACELYEAGQLTKEQAQKLLTFCNNTGPAFFFGMVGARLFPRRDVCAALYLIHILSAFLTSLLVSDSGGEALASRGNPSREAEPFPQSIQSAFFSALRLCGCVIFFSVLLRLLLDLPPVGWLLDRLPADREVTEAIVSAAVDLPSGAAAMERIGDPAIRFLLCAGAIGWGGACVHMQAAGVWQAVKLEPRGYYAAKALHALLSWILALPAIDLLFGMDLPLWPALIAISAAVIKKAVEISPLMCYHGKNEGRRGNAVPKEDRAFLRLLRTGGKGG